MWKMSVYINSFARSLLSTLSIVNLVWVLGEEGGGG